MVKGEKEKVKDRAKIIRESTHWLLYLGCQASQIGYRYLREAICVVCEMPDTISCVTKLLYPEVAKRFGTNDKQVERAIRNTIETAWEKGHPENMREIFGICNGMQGCVRPTNTEFIEEIAKRVMNNEG
ncbi:MAG: phosphoglycolate phosphatase [Lachnospiraceae bacterium]|nr:phosphoglycolate phosphatase [Lachnospiraceae bacterium]